jgi:hypothetical protein
MARLVPHSISQDENTKAFQSIQPFVPRAPRNIIVKYTEMVLMEFSVNMLETSEKYVLLISFWGSFGFTMYQLWVLFFLLRELWVSPAAIASAL